jgi:hypothetical protein
MNQSALRLFVRNIITEAKAAKKEKKEKEAKLPKSSGKLMDLKKELEALKQMKEELSSSSISEGETAEPTQVEFANLQKFSKELDKIKNTVASLHTGIDSKIKEIEDRITSEKNKIKEMIGMTPSKDQEKIEDVKKPKSDESIYEVEDDEDKIYEAKKKPSAGMTKKAKSTVVKKAKAGEDLGKKGKGFEKVAAAAGGGEKGKKVAAAAMWKAQAKK